MLVSIVAMKRQMETAAPKPTDAHLGGLPNTNPLKVLVWPLGIAATGFLLAATATIFIVWMPVIALAGLRRHAVSLRHRAGG